MMQKHLRLINSILLGLIIFINCYVIIAPLLPGLQYWYKNRFSKQQQQDLNKQVKGDPEYSGPNKLVLPQIFVDHPVLEGESIYTANKGIWRLPWTSAPDKGGNTVLVGHRFLYGRDPAVFYSLDKMKVDDELALYWNNQRYVYKVSEVKTVNPWDKSVEAPAGDDRLTLYTCTPLWNGRNRLVVIAQQIGGPTNE